MGSVYCLVPLKVSASGLLREIFLAAVAYGLLIRETFKSITVFLQSCSVSTSIKRQNIELN